MGNYNPHAPHIIGQEWVPIRQANLLPEEFVEHGYIMNIEHAVAPVSGAYYIATLPEPRIYPGVADMVNVYPAATAHLTGPIKKLNIPVSAITITGTGFSGVYTSLLSTSDDTYVRINPASTSFDELAIQFDVESYAQQLMGKRILDIKIRYTMTATLDGIMNNSVSPPSQGLFWVLQYLNASSDFINNYGFPQFDATVAGSFTPVPTHIHTFTVKSASSLWDAARTNNVTQRDVYPWRYQELSRFRAGEPSASKISVMMTNGISAGLNGGFLYFVDMEVTYCEETRVRYGGRQLTGTLSPATIDVNAYTAGPNFVRLLDTNFALGTTLPAGEYLVTLAHINTDRAFNIDGTPTVNALRELYRLPQQRGKLLNQSLVVDGEFSIDDTDVLTHITLHTAAGVVTGSHAYGNRYGAPVYSATSPFQEIEDDPAGTAAAYPQVRFYARRFGSTTVPLTLVDVATGLSTTSITVADFDALPEIVDGWKEVNLRFAVAPVFATAAGDVDFKWTAAGELVGNQWQILAASGPSPTGTQTIAPATYYAPQGGTVDLTWMSPTISGTAEDTLGDAVLIFSRDPNPVSGFAIATASQVVTGIALNCGTPPGCVPTGIGYVSLTWSAQTILPTTGFGAYELERYDAADGVWHQIMNATAPSVTGFADYEARVGTTSWYRIRTCNALDFCGPWVTGAATVPSPGVAIRGDGSSMLIFTTNEAPLSNLAYVMNWEGTPIETFVFPEAETQQFQRMYGKNFFTVFRPLERGGEQFSRTIIVNAAAIPLPSLANFRNLRNLAWQDVPYICVRDELGNRWYANVRVPDATVRQDRTIYLAQVQVTEVTDTPSPVDPA